MRKRLLLNVFAHSNRSTIREDNVHLHAMHHAPSIVFPGVDWIKFILKADMGGRLKTLNIWLERTWDGGEVEGSRPRTQKNIRGQRQPFRGQTLSRARTLAQVFYKNNNNNKIFKIVCSGVLKNTKSKNLQKNKFFYKKRCTNF